MLYADLVARVSDTTENTFETAVMDNFIRQAEVRIYQTVQLANLKKDASGTLVIGTATVDCPTDLLSIYSVAVVSTGGAWSFLLNKDINFIREAYPNPNTTGTPRHYALTQPSSGNDLTLRLTFGPTPSAALAYHINYSYRPESIVTAGDTWLGENFDNALFNGTLVEAARYMKAEPDIVKLYDDMYAQSIALLKNLGDGKQRQDGYRSGQVRTQVI
jgi:hypothetical protein